jgi:hypothetical protein
LYSVNIAISILHIAFFGVASECNKMINSQLCKLFHSLDRH